jgi:hypothetical protein
VNIFDDGVLAFFEAMNEAKAEYILVGGLAVNLHGFNRTTGDLDVWIKDSISNRSNLVTALNKLEIEGAEVFLTLPLIAGYSELLLTNGCYVDFMSDLFFLKQNDFDDCAKISKRFMIEENVEVPVLHITKLIEEKEKSQRSKDRIDTEELKKIRNK